MFYQIRKVPDPQLGLDRVTIVAGQYYVSSEEEIVCTILGSCVCAVVYDPIRQMGGMNHFMHAGAGPDASGVETVAVTLSASPVDGRLFVRVKAE